MEIIFSCLQGLKYKHPYYLNPKLNQTVSCQVIYISFNARILQHEKDLLLNNLLYLVPGDTEIKVSHLRFSLIYCDYSRSSQ